MAGEGDGDLVDPAQLSSSRRRAVRLGVAGVVLAFVALAGAQAWTIPPYQPQDEIAHVGYALLASRAQLPTIDTPIPTDGNRVLAGRLARLPERNRHVWTANHPPLFYLLAGIPLRLGTADGHPLGGLRAARLVGIGLSATGVVLAALLALWLLPGRPQIAVAGAGLVALAPVLVHVSATVYNDSLSFLTSTATLLAAATVLLRGPSRGRLAALAVVAGAASLTRASGLLLAGLAGVAAGGAVWYQRRRPPASRLLLAGGTAVLLEKFHRVPRVPVSQVLRAPGYWIAQQEHFWDVTADFPAMAGRPSRLAWLLVAAPAVGLLVQSACWLRGRRRPAPRRRLIWLLLAGIELTTADFYSRGGNAHARYVLPALAVLGIVAAAGLATLPGARRGWPALVMLTAMVVVDLVVWYQYLEVATRPKPGESAIDKALAVAVAPGPALVLPALCLALFAALAMVGWALWLLGDERERSPGVDLPRAPTAAARRWRPARRASSARSPVEQPQ